METTTPTDKDLEEMRKKVEAARRQKEYEMLKGELEAINSGAHETAPPSKRGVKHQYNLIELFIHYGRTMLSIRPIMGNIIGLLIAGMALYYLFYQVNMRDFDPYNSLLVTGIEIFAAIQIIKSGSRGLLLPVLATVIGGIFAQTMAPDQMIFNFDQDFYQRLMFVGIIGLGVSVLSID